MTAMTEMLINTDNKKKWKFQIERYMRTLSIVPGAFVVGILDCCREILPVEATRGSGAAGADSSDDDDDYRNLFLTYGCKPGGKTAAESTLAKHYF